MTFTARLVESIRHLTDGPLPEEILSKTRVILLDAISVALQTEGSPMQESLHAFLERTPDGPSTVMSYRRRVSAEAATIANSVLIHGFLQDDCHDETMSHPASVVIPVALGLGEELGASGERLLSAIIGGYEAMVRAALPIAQNAVRRGFRSSPLFGSVGAAVAAGLLLDLDDKRLGSAILIAIGNAGGTLQAVRNGSPEWRFQNGLAAQQGLTAAKFAAAVSEDLLPSREDGFEGETGFYYTLTGELPDWKTELDRREGLWELERISHKAYASCGANQSSIAAMRAILRTQHVPVPTIERIDVFVSKVLREYPGCEYRGPYTVDSAMMSKPFALAATVLAEGEAFGYPQIQSALRNSELNFLIDRIETHTIPLDELSDPDYSLVRVTLRDGRILTADQSDIDPLERHPDWRSLETRCRASVTKGQSASTVDATLEAISALPRGNVRCITDGLIKLSAEV